MALQRKEVEVPLNGGMDTKQASELQDTSTLRAVTNLRWDALGELRKRPTFASSAAIDAPDGSAYTNDDALTLFTRENDVCALTHDHGIVTVDPLNTEEVLHSRMYATVDAAENAILKYAPRGCRVSRKIIESSQAGSTHSNLGIYQCTGAVYDGTLVIGWIDYADDSWVKFRAIDLATGTTVSRTQVDFETLGYTDMNAVANYEPGVSGVVLTYATGASAPFTIKGVRYVASTRQFVSLTDLATDARFSAHSLATDEANAKMYLGYTSNAGAFPLLVKYGTAAEIAGGTATLHTANHSASHSCIVVGPTRTLIASNTTNAYAEVFGTPGSAITMFAAAAGETLLGVTAALESHVTSTHRAVTYFSAYGTGTPATNRVRTAIVDFTNTLPVEGVNSVIPNAWAAGAAFTYDGRAYGVFSLDPQVGVPTSLIVARYTECVIGATVRHDPVARLCHDRFYSPDGGILSGSGAVVVDGDKVHMVLPADPNPTPYAGFHFARSLFHGTIDFSVPVPSIEVDGTALLASGVCIEYDGETPSEHAPIHRPRVYATNEATPGTLGADVASISAIAFYRWIDKKGRIHRSGISNSSASGDVGAAPAATHRIDVYVTVPPFAGYDIYVAQYLEPELYVTADGGSTYYLAHGRLTAPDDKLDWDDFDTRDTMWVFEDVHPGTSNMPQLYSTGGDGEIVPEPPPAFLSITRIGDRVWAIDAEDRTRVWYTKPLVTGYAPEWSTTCTLAIGDEGTAIGEVNGVPTVFAARGIWQIYGDGPDALGRGSFSPARRLPFEVSCIDPNICRTNSGTVFRGRRGFYLLGESLELLGLPIDAATRAPTTADYTYTRMAFDEVSNELRIIDADGEHYWVFNLLERKWSEWTQDETQQFAVDVAVCDGRVWYLHYDDETSIRREYGVDEAQDVSRSDEDWSIQTPWIKVDGLAGFGRLWELILQIKLRAAGSVSDTVSQVEALTVTLETRSPEAGTDTFTWTGADLAALGTADGLPVDLRMRVRNQRCKAFRVTVTENPGATDNYSGSSPIALRAVMGVDSRVKNTRTSAQKGST